MSTRICVKHFPKYVQEKDLEEHFQSIGPITDRKVLRDPQGKSRCIGFIGFTKEKHVKKAIKQFHKSCIGTQRIIVEEAKAVGETDRAWSKYSEGTSAFNKRMDRRKKRGKVEKNSSGVEGVEVVKRGQLSAPSQAKLNMLAENGRVMIRNLPYSLDNDQLRTYLEQYGELKEFTVPVDETQRCKGFAFATYTNPGDGVECLTKLDGKSFCGRLLQIIPAELLKKAGETDEEGGTNFKALKEQKLKADAGNENRWHSLFINADAAIEAVASKLKMKKSDLMDRDADDLAVRMALGETEVIRETKDFLVSEGVSLDALNAAAGSEKVPRSKTVILVKNLPNDADVTELRDMFSKHGLLNRIVLPPTFKSLCIVEYLDPNNASKALSRMAYRRYHAKPLYLEFAPEDTLMKKVEEKEEEKDSKEKEEEEEDDDGTIIKERSLFVKNLNFSTTKDGLEQLFNKRIGGVVAVTIPQKKDPRLPDNMLSMGFGFVEFSSDDLAYKALKNCQNMLLDGHNLELKLSQKKISGEKTKKSRKRSKKGDASRKIMVRNLAFEATKKDLRKLFGNFGQLKAVRIPTKFDGSSRGFGFVEFMTKEDAKTAFDALQSSHLYGRHLVLEYSVIETLDTQEVVGAPEPAFNEAPKPKRRRRR
eukprot:TRINITY_DN32305_c0_g1_i1.p1 TRINITY_DN32305_c0_g1~~TRINITY_DN32305_c0_g1_i1.p1  ORF type:complete len:648 (-),score=247.38 TRINITY_DN32305_c0_g1_i1:17-1960(-)